MVLKFAHKGNEEFLRINHASNIRTFKRYVYDGKYWLWYETKRLCWISWDYPRHIME